MDKERMRMHNPYYQRYKKEYDQAPSYYHLVDDGADMICQDCKTALNPNSLLLTFTPDKSIPRVLCKDCIDEDWIAKAKDLGMINLFI